MGVVYRARRTPDGAVVALKTIRPATGGTMGAMPRFLREAGILRQLEHPGIVRFLEIGQSEGQIFLPMEYVPGLDADRLLKRNGGPLAIGRATGLICQAAEALIHAHDRGFVHRDIKPQNLLVVTSGGIETVKLADFGLARIYQDSSLSGLTMIDEMGGTPGFMAPEQITRFREARPPADQYALGATLYRLLTGRMLYDFPRGIMPKHRVMAWLQMILQQEFMPIRARRPDLPEPLAAIVHRALSRDPADRFPDVRAMRAALLPFAGPR